MDAKTIVTSLNSKSNTSHVHDERYYTEAEVNNLLNTKQDTSTAINTSNIGSQSVNYANSAGSAQPVFNNATLYLIGDDCYMGDQNVAGAVCFKGKTGATKLYLIANNADRNYIGTDQQLIVDCSNNSNAFVVCGKGIFSQKSGDGYQPVWASQFAIASSKYLKTNIKNIDEEDAKKLLKLNPVTFDYINGDKNNYGLIAEEVMKILPDLVIVPEEYNEDIFVSSGDFLEDSKNLPSVDYAKFVPHLIKMVQIQQKEIDELKNRINTL